jgi:hypothetical protein
MSALRRMARTETLCAHETSLASSSGVAKRQSSKTLSKDNEPAPRASAMTGRWGRERAALIHLLAAQQEIPSLKDSHSARSLEPCPSQATPRSHSATSSRSFSCEEPTTAWADRSLVSSSAMSLGTPFFLLMSLGDPVERGPKAYTNVCSLVKLSDMERNDKEGPARNSSAQREVARPSRTDPRNVPPSTVTRGMWSLLAAFIDAGGDD